jgi:predicted lipoprotein with Yx(FWY)xxD motif
MDLRTNRWWLLGRVVGGGLLIATAAIHLDLYITGYRTIPTIGWLFLLQVIAACVLAVGVLVTKSRLVALSGALLALSTLGGYLLSIWIGLFHFKEVRTAAGITAGVIEVAAFAVLATVALVPPDRSAAAWWRRPLEQAFPGVLSRAGAVGSATVVAAALLVTVLATASLPAASATGGPTELKTAKVGDTTVVANAQGFTLYYFVPDTPTMSQCYGLCALYWPPVTGEPVAGPGLPGKIGTIARTNGSNQVTYDAHPLYTYIGDSGPGQAHGNAIDLNGGYWYDIAVSG